MVALSRQKLSDILFWVVAALSAVLLIFLLLVAAGAVPIDSASTPGGPTTEAAEPPPATTSTQAATTERTTPASTPAKTTSRTVEPTVVVLTAVRGDSWFSARLGSENGRVLDERVLAQGESVRVQGQRIWLSVGAAGNVEVTVNGKPRALSPGTVSVVLTRAL